MAEQAPADQLIHRQIGLVQPEATHAGCGQAKRRELAGDMVGGQRADLLEYLAPLLAEQLVAIVRIAVLAAPEETGVVADVVRETGRQLAAEDFPGHRRLRRVGAFDHQRGTHVAENEVAVAVLPGEMGRADFRVDHQRGARRAGPHRIDRLFEREGRRGTGDVHVESVAAGAESALDLDRHRRVRALHVGGGADHHVDVGGGAPGRGERLGGRGHRHLGHQRKRVVRARGDARAHARRVEDTSLVHDVTLLDARGLFDELDARFRQRIDFADSDGQCVFLVVTPGISVEGNDQFFVADDLGGDPEAGTADDYVVHGTGPMKLSRHNDSTGALPPRSRDLRRCRALPCAAASLPTPVAVDVVKWANFKLCRSQHAPLSPR